MPLSVTSPTRSMLLCGMVAAMAVVPSHPTRTAEPRRQRSAQRHRASCFMKHHEPSGTQRRHQHPSPLSVAFAIMSPRPPESGGGARTGGVGAAPWSVGGTATSWCLQPSRSSSSSISTLRGRRSRSVPTALAASKSKNKRAKKKKASSGGRGSSRGGGFGSASAATTTAVASKTGAPQQQQQPERQPTTHPTAAPAAAAARGGQLPDNDFATFPPLSPDTLKSIMGVDVFDLPAGGIPASERGQQEALPPQVLECIRGRHGLQDFAGGRRLLDPEYYGTDGEAGGAALTGSSSSSGSPAAAAAAVGGEKKEGGDGTAAKRRLLFPGLRLLHAEPPVIGVSEFFTDEECDDYISRSVSPPPPAAVTSGEGAGAAAAATGSGPHMQRSATLGADVDAVAQRTSTTWFHRFSTVPELMAKASALVGVPFEEGRWEEAQTVRYRPGEKFTWHLDALPPAPDLASKGGQRIATLLVYLTEMPEGDGGATAFRDLGPLRVRPRKGSALLFFPSLGGAPDCPFDIRTLHAGEVVRPGAEQDKWIAQLWLRESRYTPTVPKQNRHEHAASAVAEFDKIWQG
ncbi:unnamed protein product [Ectocarpus sp. 4 AP-2014]